MNNFLGIIFLLVTSLSWGQDKITGFWQGMIIHSNQNIETADVIYLSLNEKEEGYTRIELLNQTVFALKNVQIKYKNGQLELEEKYLKSSANDRNAPKCKLNYSLSFDEEKGYLKGTFKSSDCRNVIGEVILYAKEDGEMNMDKEPTATHYWRHQFAQNYQKGFPSPAYMLKEQQAFEFKPIYFDHDKSEIKAEFHEYLSKMARILEGIHDLRIKVTGHTDAVGTDEYNIGLSERRARAIKEFFLERGINEDKLEIDFKGKRMPVDTNLTPEGKQRNRRVDFQFI